MWNETSQDATISIRNCPNYEDSLSCRCLDYHCITEATFPYAEPKPHHCAGEDTWDTLSRLEIKT